MSKLSDWLLERKILKYMLRHFRPNQIWDKKCDQDLHAAFPKQLPARIDQTVDELSKRGFFSIGPMIVGNSDDDPLLMYHADEAKIRAYLNAPFKKVLSVLAEYWKVAIGALIVLIVGAIWSLF